MPLTVVIFAFLFPGSGGGGGFGLQLLPEVLLRAQEACLDRLPGRQLLKLRLQLRNLNTERSSEIQFMVNGLTNHRKYGMRKHI